MDVFIRDDTGRMVVMTANGRPIVAPGANRESIVGMLFMLACELGAPRVGVSMTYGYRYDEARANAMAQGAGA